MRNVLLLICSLLFIPVLAAGCRLPGRPGGPPAALVYSGPTEQGVQAGSVVPGTDIRYVGRTAEGTAELHIGDQRALKRVGDSLNWSGSPLAGVEMQLSQRILWFNADSLQLAGTVRITIQDPQPTPGPIPQAVDEQAAAAGLVIYTVPVFYTVKKDEVLPGTTLTYAGASQEGAKLAGLPEGDYPYRRVGDSIAWRGSLRERTYLDLVVRTTFYNEDRLAVTGLAKVILATGQ